jgi:Fe-S-cluster containining protein
VKSHKTDQTSVLAEKTNESAQILEETKIKPCYFPVFPLVRGRNFANTPLPVPDDIHYQCQRCTACCRIPGFVRVQEHELPRIAAHMGLSEHDFIQRYTRLTPLRNGLALIDKPTGECFFLGANDCALQDVKPDQCLGFPNRWNFPGWREICRATPFQ